MAGGTLGGWARAIAAAVRRSGRPLLVLQVVCAVPSVLLGLLLGALAGGGGAGRWVVAAVVAVVASGLGALGQAGSVCLVLREAAGQPTAVTTAFRFGARRALPLLGWSVLAGLFTAAGLALAVLPGIYCAVVFGATLPGVVTVERGGPRRCLSLVNRRLLSTTVRCGVGLFSAAFYGSLVGVALTVLPGGAAGGLGSAVRLLAVLPLTVTGAAFSAVTYAELRQRVDGVDCAQLAAALFS